MVALVSPTPNTNGIRSKWVGLKMASPINKISLTCCANIFVAECDSKRQSKITLGLCEEQCKLARRKHSHIQANNQGTQKARARQYNNMNKGVSSRPGLVT
ncbi:unnamed protein product [Polarella glacialis]|uniref:Uncharacterized protein n=1 Tax=Polarella glacialis TaxID=89957 RepID=A0A813HB12_POLGL|nr:unnamed protein product [Polarella glacialis]